MNPVPAAFKVANPASPADRAVPPCRSLLWRPVVRLASVGLACLSLEGGRARAQTAVNSPVAAQQSTPSVATGTAPGATTPAQSGALETITVTSERRSQSAQSVGSSISVISGRTLAARNVNNVFDLQYLTPSLQVTPQFGSGQPSFAIRGLGFSDYASNNAPTVGIYMDEVAYPVPFATEGTMFDIQRVEVLRGPQGTLYGRNTTGGAINYILNKPTRTLTGGLDVQYGRFDAAKVNGYVAGPLGDRVQFRLSGETQQGGAWQHNRDGDGSMLGDVDRSGLRLIVDAEATDTLKVEVNLHGSHDRSDGSGEHLYAPLTALNGFFPLTYPVYPADTDRYATAWGASPSFAREIGIQTDTKPFRHLDTGGVSVRADQTLSFATLTDLISYDYAQRTEYDNFDAFAGGVADVYYNSRANVFANELRLTSLDAGRLSWVGGIYYSNQYLNDNYRSGFQDIYGLDGDVQYSQTVNTISGFGQANYKLTPALTAIGGLRIEHEQRDLNDFSSYFISDGAITNPNNSVGPQSTSFTEPSGKAELEYSPLHDDMVYASVSRGVKSGGFTTYNSGSPETSTAPFKPERLWAYEVGNKLELPAQHLRFNLSAFYYDYHDQQIQSATVNAQTGLVGAIVNAPKSHLYGGEFEANWSPIRNLTLTQGGGWATGQFDVFESVLTAVRVNGVYVGVFGDRKGDSLPAPKITLNGSISYRWDLGRFDLLTGADYSLRSTYRSLFGSLYDVAGYTLVNANATLSPKGGRWSLSAFGQNILDKQYDVDRNFFVAGDDVALAGLPATWGVRASVNF